MYAYCVGLLEVHYQVTFPDSYSSSETSVEFVVLLNTSFNSALTAFPLKEVSFSLVLEGDKNKLTLRQF